MVYYYSSKDTAHYHANASCPFLTGGYKFISEKKIKKRRLIACPCTKGHKSIKTTIHFQKRAIERSNIKLSPEATREIIRRIETNQFADHLQGDRYHLYTGGALKVLSPDLPDIITVVFDKKARTLISYWGD